MYIILIIVLLLPSFLLAQPKDNLVKLPSSTLRNFSPEDLLSLSRVSDPQISPDGKWVMYSLSKPSLEKGTFKKDLYATRIDGSETISITDNIGSDYNGRWINDQEILFISSRMGKPQLFRKKIGDDEPLMLTVDPNGIHNVILSPDQNNILFTTDVKIGQEVSDIYPETPNANVYMYDDLPVRHWDSWEDVSYSHLFISPFEKTKIKLDLMEGEAFDTPLMPFGGSEQIAWSPDSKKIAYTSKKVDNYELSTNSDIYLVDLISKETINITGGRDGYDMNPSFSPDGKYIAFHSQVEPGFEADRIRLMLYDTENQEIRELSVDFKHWVGGFIWSPDSKYIYFDGADGKARNHIYRIDLSGKYELLTDGDYNYSGSLSISSDGSTLVTTRHNFHRPSDIVTINTATGKVNQITNLNNAILAAVKDLTWEAKYIETVDGKKMHSWFIYPPDFDANKKYPTIIYCQGGPQSTIDQFFSYRWNFFVMASQGYVVIAPNRRGMPGFGQEWNDAISNDWGGLAMQDILSATDYAADKPFVNAEEMAAVGASAGGYTTFWLAGNHDNRFRALISHCGVFNLTSMYGSTEELFFTQHEFGGPYWEKEWEEGYIKNSPHSFVDKWNTPMLIITGLNDFRVPYTQSLEAFTAAQNQGVPSKLLVFPEENHWVLRLQNAYVWQKEFFKFLKNHLK